MRIIIFFAMAMSFLGCSNKSGYVLKFEMDEYAGSYILLNTTENSDLNVIDSVLLNNSGEGIISGSVEYPEAMYISQQGTNNISQIFIDNNHYTISGNSFQDIKIEVDEGPQAEYNNYKKQTLDLEKEMQEIAAKYRKATEESNSGNTLELLGAEYEKAQNKKSQFDSLFIAQNPKSFISLHLLRRTYYRLTADQLDQQLSVIDPSLQQTEYYVSLSEHLNRMKNVMIGKKYTDFELPDEEGNPMKISDVADNGLLLIDFWASWCGPCRRVNPEIVEIYNEFKDKGFDIMGVSLDTKKENWLQAIEDDKLTWNHISDLQGWQSAGARLYAVNSIPHTVLIDASGKIVARNLSKEELKNTLNTMLN